MGNMDSGGIQKSHEVTGHQGLAVPGHCRTFPKAVWWAVLAQHSGELRIWSNLTNKQHQKAGG